MSMLATLFILLTAQAPADPPLPDGCYCHAEFLWGDTGRERISLGELTARADLSTPPGGRVIAFRNKMPDSPRLLIFETPARPDDRGVLHFEFDDNWGNGGTGTLTPDGVIALEVTRPGSSASIDIRRNYGTFALSADGCPATG